MSTELGSDLDDFKKVWGDSAKEHVTEACAVCGSMLTSTQTCSSNSCSHNSADWDSHFKSAVEYRLERMGSLTGGNNEIMRTSFKGESCSPEHRVLTSVCVNFTSGARPSVSQYIVCADCLTLLYYAKLGSGVEYTLKFKLSPDEVNDLCIYQVREVDMLYTMDKLVWNKLRDSNYKFTNKDSIKCSYSDDVGDQRVFINEVTEAVGDSQGLIPEVCPFCGEVLVGAEMSCLDYKCSYNGLSLTHRKEALVQFVETCRKDGLCTVCGNKLMSTGSCSNFDCTTEQIKSMQAAESQVVNEEV